MSVVCEAFQCSPREAMRQDPRLVQEVLEYRMARWAVDVFEGGERGIETMQRHPELAELILEMHRAQTGQAGTRAGLLKDMEARKQADNG